MNKLYKNINANFRVVLDFGMNSNHAKKMVARLGGRVILDITHDGDDYVKVTVLENGLRNKVRMTKVMAEVEEFDFDAVFAAM